jgi:large subunit ribosomal protein L5
MNHTPYFKEQYNNNVIDNLSKKFSLPKYRVPKLSHVVLNMRFGKFLQDNELKRNAISALELISGRKSMKVLAKKSVSQFKIRTGMLCGAKVTLRRDDMYEFWARQWIALPRMRNFEGFNPRSCDKYGNYSFTLDDWTAFPECDTVQFDFKNLDKIQIAVNISTTSQSKDQTIALLEEMGLPFKKS